MCRGYSLSWSMCGTVEFSMLKSTISPWALHTHSSSVASGIRARKSMRQLSSTGNLYNFDKLDLLYVLSLFVVDLKLVKFSNSKVLILMLIDTRQTDLEWQLFLIGLSDWKSSADDRFLISVLFSEKEKKSIRYSLLLFHDLITRDSHKFPPPPFHLEHVIRMT